MIYIPSGEFLMGSDPQQDKNARQNEQPQHTLYLPEFAIAKTPTTNAQYLTFIQATSYKIPQLWRQLGCVCKV
jgi:formylglycine-generating enzyme required for sulfatase activity